MKSFILSTKSKEILNHNFKSLKGLNYFKIEARTDPLMISKTKSIIADKKNLKLLNSQSSIIDNSGIYLSMKLKENEVIIKFWIEL